MTRECGVDAALRTEVLSLLKAADESSDFMARPAPVHFFQLPPGFLQDGETELPKLDLDIAMTVTSRGNVRDAEILNPPEFLAEDTLEEILQLIRHTPFRPAIRAGDIVTTRDFVWQFVILPPPQAS